MNFQLGHIVSTCGVSNWMSRSQENSSFVYNSISRHGSCDWGDVCDDDKELNNQALNDGCRVLSSYSHGNDKIWIITEADRSVTTVLFPEEY